MSNRQPHHYPYLPPPSSQAGPSRSRSTSTLPPETYLPPPSSFYTPTQPPNSRTPSSTSSVFAFRPPYLPTPRPRSSNSESPTKPTSDQLHSGFSYPQQPSARAGSVSTARSRVPGGFSQHEHEHEHEHETGDHGVTSDDGDGEGEQQKLAIKREKNRIKQQKLRLRRANHISDLETSLERAQNDYNDLQTLYEASLKKEQGLQRYSYSLEGILRRYGLQSELEALQNRQGAGGVKREVEEGRSSALPQKRRKTTNTDLPRYAESSGTADHTSHPQRTGPDPLHQTQYHPLSDPSSRPTRPRTSTSSFPPLHLSQTQTPEALSAPSPRSIRIADLLSPSLITQSFQAYPILPPDRGWTGTADTGWTSTALAQVQGEKQERGQVVLSPRPLGGVAMRYGESADSLGGQSSAVSAVEGYLDGGKYPTPKDLVLGGDAGLPLPPLSTPLTLPPPYSAPSPSTISHPPLHPSVHSARVLLRAMLASNPASAAHYTLPPLMPDHQKILLNAIYNLTTPSFRDQVNAAQIRNMPPLLMKCLMAYSHSSSADLRVVLMPIAILRARIVGFLKDELPFDITAFISHVLADALVFGDTADPDSWEMSDEFWDVWGGWFKAGRTFCKSLSKWRRRYGHKGASVVEILLGTEGEMSRMKEVLIGRPEGWKRPEVLPPDKEMLVGSGQI